VFCFSVNCVRRLNEHVVSIWKNKSKCCVDVYGEEEEEEEEDDVFDFIIIVVIVIVCGCVCSLSLSSFFTCVCVRISGVLRAICKM